MRSNTVDRLLKSMPKDIEVFVDLYADIVVRINQILREKKISKKELADLLGKKPSEISKWLNGGHNFTLRSLSKLSAELGEPLLEVPMRQEKTVYKDDGSNCIIYPLVTNTKRNCNTANIHWQTGQSHREHSDALYGS